MVKKSHGLKSSVSEDTKLKVKEMGWETWFVIAFYSLYV